MHKKSSHTTNSHKKPSHTSNMHKTSPHTSNSHKKSSHTNNMHKKPSHTNNLYEKPPHKNHRILTICMKKHYTNIVRINIFAVINQINKHKANIYNQCMYTLIIIKKNHFFSLQSIRMSGNKINFDDKKIQKKRLLKKQKNI